MYYVSSIAERAILSIDRFINQAMTYAWTASLEHRCPAKELISPLRRQQPAPEEDFGGGDLCSPRRKLQPTMINHSNDRMIGVAPEVTAYGRSDGQYWLSRFDEETENPTSRLATCPYFVQNLKIAPIVKNSSRSVFAEQVTGVFGLVGAGRTEIFKVVARVLKPDFFPGGEILLAQQAGALPATAPAVRGFFETMSVARNLSRHSRQISTWPPLPVQARVAAGRRHLDIAVEGACYRHQSQCGRTVRRQISPKW